MKKLFVAVFIIIVACNKEHPIPITPDEKIAEPIRKDTITVIIQP